jgi:hypothetical protein
MCHLTRFAEKRKDLHPKDAEFVDTTIRIVDNTSFILLDTRGVLQEVHKLIPLGR